MTIYFMDLEYIKCMTLNLKKHFEKQFKNIYI